jgi:hypothetical protein
LKIKFHITPVYPYGDDHYYHEIIAAAEGFEALGHIIYGNANYWWQPEKQQFLIKEDKSKDFDIAIYDYRYAKSFEHLLFREGYPNFDKNKKHVLIDRNDWISPIWLNNDHYKIYDVICAGNLYKNYKYPTNVKPWSIGITNRIMSYIDKTINDDKNLDPIAGYNFRVDHNMRGYLLKNIKDLKLPFPVTERFTDSIQQTDIDLPEVDKSYWKQSTKRHNPAYYNILNKSLLFFSFGGYYESKPLIYQPYTFFDKLKRKPSYWSYKKKKNNNVDFSDDIFIFQQDNFRFWEVLYSNSTPINLNFEYWNFLLPATPEDGKHYLGVKELDGKSLKQKLEKLSIEEIKAIGKNGRDWCNENYSPKAIAMRILDYLNIK